MELKTGGEKIFSMAAVVVAAVLFGMVLAGGMGITPGASAERSSPPALPNFADLADEVIPSVVSVYTADKVEPEEMRRRMRKFPFHFFFGPDIEEFGPRVERSEGSAFFISPDGELLTNNHVVEGADKVEIALADGTTYEVEVVGRDPATDIALLRVKNPKGAKFKPLPLGDSDAIRVGEWVMAVGNPLHLEHTVTVGVISAKGRRIGLTDRSFDYFLQTDAAINFGNSGGPLVNLAGEVVGINTAINISGENLGFAVPINTAKLVLDQLRKNGKVVRGYLGVMIRDITPEFQEAFGLPSREGAFVDGVEEGHAGDKAGIKEADVIIEVDGVKVKDSQHLIRLISSKQPGTKVKIKVLRDGKEKVLVAELEERPEPEEPMAALAPGGTRNRETVEKLGIAVEDLSQRLRNRFGIPDDIEGVVVTEVMPLSDAHDKGIQRSDVIINAARKPVRSVRDFRKLVGKLEPGDLIPLRIYRPRTDMSFFVVLRVSE